MGVLLRLTKQTIWSGEPPDAGRREGAVLTFRRREEDTDGISVFEVADDAERELVVAAIACERANEKPVDLLEVPREILERYGRIDPTEGTTFVPAANALHRSLNWDAETLERLADELFESRAAARRYKVPEVRAAVRKLEVDALLGEEAKAFVRELKAKA
jgi:hypothetical protein